MSSSVPLPDRADIVAEARSWLGTPYHHQQREKGRFVDCVGLIIGVARRFDLGDYRSLDYTRIPDPEHMAAKLLANLDPILPEQAQPGDILWFALAGVPRHVGILADHPQGSGFSLIHAYAEIGRVVEHRLDAKWRRRICGAYSYRGLD